MTFVPMSSTALVGVDSADAGVASALVNTTQQVGGSLGTALLNTVAAAAAASYLTANAHAGRAVQIAAVHGYTTAFTVSAALLAAAALAAGVLIRASRHHVQREVVVGDRPVSGSELIGSGRVRRLHLIRAPLGDGAKAGTGIRGWFLQRCCGRPTRAG